MDGELIILAGTAASIAIVHTLIGPDHYVPFLAMSRARRWSFRRTLAITVASGLGHVAGSVVLGLVGILLGLAVGGLEAVEGSRGELAAWLLIGFGLAYLVWGLHRALRRRPHAHWHAHGDGTVHRHRHRHVEEHVHVHDAAARPGPDRRADASRGGRKRLTPWILFTIFVFGPCEPLIPLLMYPAAERSWWGVGLVTAVFGVCTVLTMAGAVAVGYYGLSRVSFGRLERFGHALAGLAVVACGAAIRLGF